MSRIFLTAFLWIVIVLSAQAKDAIIRVTASHLRANGFVFAVTNVPLSNGVAFHITITASRGELPAVSDCKLYVATSPTKSYPIGSAVPGIRVAVKKARRVWKAQFVVSDELLTDAGTSFVFSVFDHEGPGADHYVVKLRDFTKQ